jgi:Transposase
MSAAFVKGIGEHLPKARMAFDRHHVAAKLSEAGRRGPPRRGEGQPGVDEGPLPVG